MRAFARGIKRQAFRFMLVNPLVGHRHHLLGAAGGAVAAGAGLADLAQAMDRGGVFWAGPGPAAAAVVPELVERPAGPRWRFTWILPMLARRLGRSAIRQASSMEGPNGASGIISGVS